MEFSRGALGPRPSSTRTAGVVLAWLVPVVLVVAFCLINLAPSFSARTSQGFTVSQQSPLPPTWGTPEEGLQRTREAPINTRAAYAAADLKARVARRQPQQTTAEGSSDGAGDGSSSHMRTTLRLCPAAPSSVVLPRGSRWLFPVAPRVASFAWSVSEAGERILSADLPFPHIDGPQLRYGTGYGMPQHESAHWQTIDWASYVHQQTEGRLRREGEADPASFDVDPPDLQRRLQWLASYDFHNLDLRQAELPSRYEPSRAPWYEVEVKDEGADTQRLLLMEAEFLRPNQPFRRGLWSEGRREGETDGEAGSMVDGVSLLATIMPLVNSYDALNVSLFDIPFSNDRLAGRLFSRMHCSFTAELHVDASDPVFTDALAAVEALRTSEPLLASMTDNPLWKGVSHHFVHCPLPRLSPSSQRLLSVEAEGGPPLSLTSVSLTLLDAADWASFGFRSLTLPLCLMRSRTVKAAVILSSQLGPPHMVRPSMLHDFLSYYLFLGVQRFHIPDRYGSLLPSLLPYMAHGVVSYMRQPFLTPHHQPYLDQVPVLAVCLMRERSLADWILSIDLDELLTLDHPYWAEGKGVRAPDETCWGEGNQPCTSTLTDFLSQPGMEELSLLILPSVPQWGLSSTVNQSLTALSASSAGSTVPLSSALTVLAPFHPLDVWSRRSHAAEFHRFKCLFRPLHVQTITMHDVNANPLSVEAGITKAKVEAWHKYWGDAGLQRHKEHILRHTILNDHRTITWHPRIHLPSILCSPDVQQRADVQRAFNLSCCALTVDGPSASNSTRAGACFTDMEGFDPYLLSTLTPLFPTVAQSNPKSPPHLVLPVKIPVSTYPLPLSLFGLHISHVFCMFLHPRVWPTCSTAQLTWNKGPMWGEGKRDGTAFLAEEEDERGRLLVANRLRQWLDTRPWMDHRDMRGYEERKRRWSQRLGR